MQLVIVNGSPRGKGGNSEVIINWLTEGLQQKEAANIDVLHLNRIAEHPSVVRKLQAADTALIIFPLYTDSMPGLVMAFIEKLEPLRKSLTNLRLGFIIHSGFPEAVQLRAVEKYLNWLAGDLGVVYLGTVVMGGSEGTRFMSPAEAASRKAIFAELGLRLATENKFHADLVKQAAGIERFGPFIARIISIGSKLGLSKGYWDRQLKRNNAYEDRFAQPYAPDTK